MDPQNSAVDLGSIFFTYDQEHGVSHYIDLGYPGDDPASLIQAAIGVIELSLTHSLSKTFNDEYENNPLLLLQGVSELIDRLKNLQSSVVFDNPTLKEIYEQGQKTETPNA